MNVKIGFFHLLGLGLLLLASCRPAANDSPTVLTGDTNRQVYQVAGVIQEVMADRNKLKIQHEEIPDYMEAMTMTFNVKGSDGLEQFQPGDTVEFKMIVTATDGWIENVTKTGETTVTPPPFRVVREVEPLDIGDFMPEYQFTNQFGQPFRLAELRGQAVAFTFLFTRCAFPTFCPRMAGNLAATQQKLRSIPNAPTNWHLLCITFDPEFDTPPVLKSYAEAFAYDPDRWSFLTGTLIDITAAAEHFGLMFWRSDPTKPTSIDHNLRTVVLDTNGRVYQILPENEWTADQLAETIIKASQVPIAAPDATGP